MPSNQPFYSEGWFWRKLVYGILTLIGGYSFFKGWIVEGDLATVTEIALLVMTIGTGTATAKTNKYSDGKTDLMIAEARLVDAQKTATKLDDYLAYAGVIMARAAEVAEALPKNQTPAGPSLEPKNEPNSSILTFEEMRRQNGS